MVNEKKLNRELNIAVLVAVILAVGISFILNALYTDRVLDNALKDVPRRVCHNETKDTGMIVCSASTEDLKQINYTFIQKVYYNAESIDSVSVNNKNLTYYYDNCIPYVEINEVCELK